MRRGLPLCVSACFRAFSLKAIEGLKGGRRSKSNTLIRLRSFSDVGVNYVPVVTSSFKEIIGFIVIHSGRYLSFAGHENNYR